MLSPEDYAAWAAEAGAIAPAAFDPADKAAHWGWAWERTK